MNRKFTQFECALINELANIANLLVDRLNAGRGDLSAVALREVVETTIRVAAARKRLARLRRLRRLTVKTPELERLRLDRVDLESHFGCEDLKKLEEGSSC